MERELVSIFFYQKLSEPKGEVISSKIDRLAAIYFKIQMGVAGSIFEPHSSNFGNQPIF
jgi:hypothetical protein